MSSPSRLYRKQNYTIQKSINLEDKLYTKLKYIAETEYDATISEVINVCIENLLAKKIIKYYPKPEGEIIIYRSIMIRKENEEALRGVNLEKGISVTRLINTAIKEFIEEHEKEVKDTKSA
ncbi:MAG: hypothetical protein HFJ51_00165 [Clostridia bacterium]|nr:hypothetical protein [Clostridia bacterium]